jgi:predicted site-specific integrase-resolvase
MEQYGAEMFLAHLSGNRISSSAVCEILKISERTLTNYITDGKLRVTNEGKRAHEFDFSDVVKFFLKKTNKLKM